MLIHLTGAVRRPPEGDATSCIIERAQSEVGLGWRGRLISHAPQLGRTGGAGTYPGLRVTLPCPADAWQGVTCRSEPGILSARPLRGSEGVNTIRRRGERTQGAKRGGWGDLSLRFIYEDPYAA